MKKSLWLLWSSLVLCAAHIGHAQTIREQIDTILSRPALAGNTWTIQVQNDAGTGNARAGLDYIATKLKNLGVTNVTGDVQCYGVCYYRRSSTDTDHNLYSQDAYNAEAASAFLAALQAKGISVSGSATGQLGFN